MIPGVVYTALKALVADRCYPSTFPQSPTNDAIWPAIRYTIISADPVPDICGTDTGETDQTTVQVDYVAKTHGAAVALREQGRAALMATFPPCTRQNGFEIYDSETKTHRATDDYLFQPSSSNS